MYLNNLGFFRQPARTEIGVVTSTSENIDGNKTGVKINSEAEAKKITKSGTNLTVEWELNSLTLDMYKLLLNIDTRGKYTGFKIGGGLNWNTKNYLNLQSVGMLYLVNSWRFSLILGGGIEANLYPFKKGYSIETEKAMDGRLIENKIDYNYANLILGLTQNIELAKGIILSFNENINSTQGHHFISSDISANFSVGVMILPARAEQLNQPAKKKK